MSITIFKVARDKAPYLLQAPLGEELTPALRPTNHRPVLRSRDTLSCQPHPQYCQALVQVQAPVPINPNVDQIHYLKNGTRNFSG